MSKVVIKYHNFLILRIFRHFRTRPISATGCRCGRLHLTTSQIAWRACKAGISLLPLVAICFTQVHPTCPGSFITCMWWIKHIFLCSGNRLSQINPIGVCTLSFRASLHAYACCKLLHMKCCTGHMLRNVNGDAACSGVRRAFVAQPFVWLQQVMLFLQYKAASINRQQLRFCVVITLPRHILST